MVFEAFLVGPAQTFDAGLADCLPASLVLVVGSDVADRLVAVLLRGGALS